MMTISQKIISSVWIVSLIVGCIIIALFVADEMIVLAGIIFLLIMIVLTILLYSSIYGTDWITDEKVVDIDKEMKTKERLVILGLVLLILGAIGFCWLILNTVAG